MSWSGVELFPRRPRCSARSGMGDQLSVRRIVGFRISGWVLVSRMLTSWLRVRRRPFFSNGEPRSCPPHCPDSCLRDERRDPSSRRARQEALTRHRKVVTGASGSWFVKRLARTAGNSAGNTLGNVFFGFPAES
jgi:hypothetical protein